MNQPQLFPESASLNQMNQPQKYRPSNGTEGDIFFLNFCAHCKHEDLEGEAGPCEIFGRTMAFDIDAPEYPNEWQQDENGNGFCTAFEAENENREFSLEELK